jgi:hypothetical protein
MDESLGSGVGVYNRGQARDNDIFEALHDVWTVRLVQIK